MISQSLDCKRNWGLTSMYPAGRDRDTPLIARQRRAILRPEPPQTSASSNKFRTEDYSGTFGSIKMQKYSNNHTFLKALKSNTARKLFCTPKLPHIFACSQPFLSQVLVHDGLRSAMWLPALFDSPEWDYFANEGQTCIKHRGGALEHCLVLKRRAHERRVAAVLCKKIFSVSFANKKWWFDRLHRIRVWRVRFSKFSNCWSKWIAHQRYFPFPTWKTTFIFFEFSLKKYQVSAVWQRHQFQMERIFHPVTMSQKGVSVRRVLRRTYLSISAATALQIHAKIARMSVWLRLLRLSSVIICWSQILSACHIDKTLVEWTHLHKFAPRSTALRPIFHTLRVQLSNFFFLTDKTFRKKQLYTFFRCLLLQRKGSLSGTLFHTRSKQLWSSMFTPQTFPRHM